MYPDFKELLSALNDHKVKYLVVGAYAVGQYAQPRATKDLDILIQPTAKNAAAVFRVLREFGAPLRDLVPADLIAKGSFFTMGVPPIAIDILNEIAGINFASAWKNRSTKVVDAESGQFAHFISRDDLIAAKLASGRMRDLGDVEALRDADRAQGNRGNEAKPKRKPKRIT
jgi:hypothetical protein